MVMSGAYHPIENYGVIGNLQTVALIGMDASIDFLCFPYFDSPSIFASLLDSERGGRFILSPTFQHRRPKQMYLSNSNILLTRFLSPDGVVEVCDFMPISLESGRDRVEPVHQLIRRAKCVRGEVQFQMACDPRLDYGRAKQQVKLLSEKEALFFPDCGERSISPIRLRSEVPLVIREGRVESEFVLSAGQSALFILEGDEDAPHAIDPHRVGEEFKATLNFWQSWVAQSTYRGRWREMVDRSALVLKLLVSQRHGSIVAAPTFGLPEAIGAGRNWDYRYTWIRDASFTLYALSRLGFHSESRAFMQWLAARCRDLGANEPLQIMYGTDGRRDLTEVELSHWEGYRGSSPVRIGNGAHDQVQLDIYGELLDSVARSPTKRLKRPANLSCPVSASW